MNTNILKTSSHPGRAQQAVDWFLRVERGEPSVDDLMQWQQWMEASSTNRAAYESVQRTWQKLDSVDALPWPTAAEIHGDVASTREPSAVVSKHARWPLWAAAASLGTIGIGIFLYDPGARWPRQFPELDVVTTIAEHRELRLPDGSQMQVGAQTHLQVDFSPQQRSIHLLSGEAFFTVGKDAARPFVVEAGAGRVTAIGTAFNVRRYQAAITVEVAEGQVRLEPSNQTGVANELRPGQEAEMDASGALQTLRQVPSEQVASWRIGQHRYIDTPLKAVVADLNRYATLPVRIDDPATGELRITTTFFSDDWGGWLETLGTAAPSLHVRQEGAVFHIGRR